MILEYETFLVTQEDIHEIQEGFSDRGMPRVIGVIDGTHVRIIAVRENEADYVNRKSFYLINTQVVFDTNYLTRDIIVNWPGSIRDSRILRNSAVSHLFREGRVPPRDSGYPLRTWLLTPYLHPNGPHLIYNR